MISAKKIDAERFCLKRRKIKVIERDIELSFNENIRKRMKKNQLKI